MDIFEMRKFADNAVGCHVMKVGVENERVDDYKIAIVENGRNCVEVNLYSEEARKLVMKALDEQKTFDEEQMKKIADGIEVRPMQCSTQV